MMFTEAPTHTLSYVVPNRVGNSGRQQRDIITELISLQDAILYGTEQIKVASPGGYRISMRTRIDTQ